MYDGYDYCIPRLYLGWKIGILNDLLPSKYNIENLCSKLRQRYPTYMKY